MPFYTPRRKYFFLYNYIIFISKSVKFNASHKKKYFFTSIFDTYLYLQIYLLKLKIPKQRYAFHMFPRIGKSGSSSSLVLSHLIPATYTNWYFFCFGENKKIYITYVIFWTILFLNFYFSSPKLSESRKLRQTLWRRHSLDTPQYIHREALYLECWSNQHCTLFGPSIYNLNNK